jgi:geranylgeranyl transferase type-2 subunit alpha
LRLIARSPEEVVGLLKNELKLTMAYLQIHPKVYWIWNHRKWCLEHVPPGPEPEAPLEEGENETKEEEGRTKSEGEGWRCGFWKGELAVIEALLDADPRNCMSISTSVSLTLYHQEANP